MSYRILAALRLAPLALLSCRANVEVSNASAGSAGNGGFDQTEPGTTSSISTSTATCVAAAPVIEIASKQFYPLAIHVDAESTLYWANSVQDGPAQITGGSIMRAGMNGGDLTEVAGEQGQPVSVTTDQSAVYWTTMHGKVAVRPKKTGDQPSVLYADPSGKVAFSDIASDDESVFFTSILPGALGKIHLADGSVTVVANEDDALWLLSVDESDVYFSGSGGHVWRASKEDLLPSVFYQAAAGASVGGVKVDGDTVYWTVSPSNCFETGHIMRAPKAGGEPEELAPGYVCGSRLAIDEKFIYWTEPLMNRVMKIALDGGEPMAIACDQDQPEGIAVDATHVYWTNANPLAGTIMKAPK